MSLECINNNNNTVTFKFAGRMDTTKSMEAEVQVLESIKGAEKVVFDLEALEYIASSFLRICGKASQAVGSENFSIINVTPSVKKVFKIAGLAERLNIS